MESAPHTHIAIIGAGFSGTLALANLVRLADSALTIAMFENTSLIAKGVAYSTTDTSHLLNVPAGRMGAFANDLAGFYTWLQQAEGKQAVQSVWPGNEIKPESFVPRALYGVYITHIFQSAIAEAKTKQITINLHQAMVTNAQLYDPDTQRLKLTYDEKGRTAHLLADCMILATGNLPPRSFAFESGLVRGAEHYIANVWQPSSRCLFPKQLKDLPADAEIVVLGTGLTMVDTVLTLKNNGYKGLITAISRNGWLPTIHHYGTPPYPTWEWTQNPASAPKTALSLFMRLRQELEQAIASGHDWRSVIDSLRPITQTLWKSLNMRERRSFMKRLSTLWNIHRHRMAPEVGAEIRKLLQSGTLRIVAAKIYYVGSDENGLTVAHRKRSTNRIETIRANLVINCTGPEYDIAASQHRLLRNLRDHELITVGPLRTGIEIMRGGGVKGNAPDAILPIGVLLVGELLESAAVPELRDQAADVAARALLRLKKVSKSALAEAFSASHI